MLSKGSEDNSMWLTKAIFHVNHGVNLDAVIKKQSVFLDPAEEGTSHVWKWACLRGRP